MAIVKMLERARYGARSERLGKDRLTDDQYALALDEIETGVAALEAEREKAAGPATTKRPPRPRKGFAPHLERVEVVIEPDDPPGCEGLERVRIGEDVCERLDVTPAQFRVIVTRRPNTSIRAATASSRPRRRLGSSKAVSQPRRCWPRLPWRNTPMACHCTVRRRSTPATRSSLSARRWRSGWARSGLSSSLWPSMPWRGSSRASGFLPMRQPCRPWRPGRARQTAYLWAYVRDDRPFGGSDPPIVVYRFEDSRAGDCVARHLEGYRGVLQVDGYTAYHRLARPEGANEGVQLAACWSHVRRKFYELHVSDASIVAGQTLEQMAALWALEDSVRGKAAMTHMKARQETSAAVVSTLFKLWEKELPKLSRKSKLAEAIRDALTRRASLERFLSDGRVELDSNTVERAIRPQTITRKNSLFAGSDGGGRTWAAIASLLATAKMNNVGPHAWLTQTLERIANGWPNREIEALMPWNYQP